MLCPSAHLRLRRWRRWTPARPSGIDDFRAYERCAAVRRRRPALRHQGLNPPGGPMLNRKKLGLLAGLLVLALVPITAQAGPPSCKKQKKCGTEIKQGRMTGH